MRLFVVLEACHWVQSQIGSRGIPQSRCQIWIFFNFLIFLVTNILGIRFFANESMFPMGVIVLPILTPLSSCMIKVAHREALIAHM